MGRIDAVPSSGQSQVASVKSVLSPQTTKKYTAQEMREVYTDAQPRSFTLFFRHRILKATLWQTLRFIEQFLFSELGYACLYGAICD